MNGSGKGWWGWEDLQNMLVFLRNRVRVTELFDDIITAQQGDFTLPWKLLLFRNTALLPSIDHKGSSTLIPLNL